MQTSLCTFLWVRKAALVMAALPAPLSLLSPHPVTHITDIQCDGQTWEDVLCHAVSSLLKAVNQTVEENDNTDLQGRRQIRRDIVVHGTSSAPTKSVPITNPLKH